MSWFITSYIPFDKTAKDSIYKLSDEYSLFYLKYFENVKTAGAGTWLRLSSGASYTSWGGLAFEAICQKHVVQLKKALEIGGVLVETSAWRHVPQKGEQGAQIDLLLTCRTDASMSVRLNFPRPNSRLIKSMQPNWKIS